MAGNVEEETCVADKRCNNGAGQLSGQCAASDSDTRITELIAGPPSVFGGHFKAKEIAPKHVANQ